MAPKILNSYTSPNNPEFTKTRCGKTATPYNTDGNVSTYIPVPDVTAARNLEVLVVRTFWILEGDGCSALLLLPLPLLSSPFLTGVVAVLRVMKRRSGVAVELPEPSREPY